MEIDQVSKMSEKIDKRTIVCIRGDGCSYTFLPTGSENKQMVLLDDYTQNTCELYRRDRENKNCEWNNWEFLGKL